MRLVVRSKIGKKLFYILNHTYGNNASVTSIGSKWPVYFHKSNLVKVGYVNLNRKELKMNEQKTKNEIFLEPFVLFALINYAFQQGIIKNV